MPPPPRVRERTSHYDRKWPALFDDLVGDREQSVRHVEAERFRGLEVDDKLVLDRLLDRQIRQLGALEDAVDVTCRLAELFREVSAIGDQAARFHKKGDEID